MPKQKAKTKQDCAPSTVLLFSQDHLWVRAEADHAQVGISDFGQSCIGEIIAIELPEIGEEIERGEPFGEIESVRTVQELIAPISGTVRAVNIDLEDQPSLTNEDPYHEGWLIEVEIADDEDLQDLLVSDDYDEIVAARDGD